MWCFAEEGHHALSWIIGSEKGRGQTLQNRATLRPKERLEHRTSDCAHPRLCCPSARPLDLQQ